MLTLLVMLGGIVTCRVAEWCVDYSPAVAYSHLANTHRVGEKADVEAVGYFVYRVLISERNAKHLYFRSEGKHLGLIEVL